MDYSLPGSSIHGIFQVRVLEWGAIAFSNNSATNSLIQFDNTYIGSIKVISASFPLYLE